MAQQQDRDCKNQEMFVLVEPSFSTIFRVNKALVK